VRLRFNPRRRRTAYNIRQKIKATEGEKMRKLYYIALEHIENKSDIIYIYSPIKHEIGNNFYYNGNFYKIIGYMPVEI
jgi:hypothetical protein